MKFSVQIYLYSDDENSLSFSHNRITSYMGESYFREFTNCLSETNWFIFKYIKDGKWYQKKIDLNKLFDIVLSTENGSFYVTIIDASGKRNQYKIYYVQFFNILNRVCRELESRFPAKDLFEYLTK